MLIEYQRHSGEYGMVECERFVISDDASEFKVRLPSMTTVVWKFGKEVRDGMHWIRVYHGGKVLMSFDLNYGKIRRQDYV